MKSNLDSQPYIFGCGYVGKELCKQLIARNQSPHAIVQSEQSVVELKRLSIRTTSLNLDQSLPTKEELDLTTRNVYYLVPPNSNAKGDQRLDRFLQLCRKYVPRRIVYISTSGVYGNCDGNWVTEDNKTAPLTARAKRRVYAEQTLREYCRHSKTEYMILRVGGIYGPERLPIHRLTDIKVICPEEAPFSNRIHVEDLAQICIAAMECNKANEIFNVADGHPTTMTDYYYRIADFANLPRPTCVSMSQANEKLSPGILSFVNESRRLSVKKMHAILGIQLRYPTLQQGLEHCFEKLHVNRI